MQLDCRIRQANPDDAIRLREMNLTFNECDVSAESIAEKLKGASAEVVLVAETGDGVVGFVTAQRQSSICYDEMWAEVLELYVVPEVRRRGVGSALITGVEEILKASGAGTYFLRTNTKNTDAQAFYRVRGMKQKPHVVFEKSLGKE
jgi:ribosomal protein S18 acetylase RimI-like enzyme